MPDFEDSNCPTWKNLIEGQVGALTRRALGTAGSPVTCARPAVRAFATTCTHLNIAGQSAQRLTRLSISPLCLRLQINLRDAVRRTISLSAGGKTYRLNDKVAVMLVRPRG
jgi:malate synthase